MDIHFVGFALLAWACGRIFDNIFGFIFGPSGPMPNIAAARVLAGVQ